MNDTLNTWKRIAWEAARIAAGIIAGLIAAIFIFALPIYFELPSNNAKISQIDAITVSKKDTQVLMIPKLNIRVPIQRPVGDTWLKDSSPGVILYPRSVNPGRPGNTVLVNAVKGDIWDNPYKNVFIGVDLLDLGDEIVIDYNEHRYAYSIVDHFISAQDDKSVLAQNQDDRILTLVTPFPFNTRFLNYVVKAELIKSKDVQSF